MAKTKISEFNANPALNTDIDSINIAEGCAPSGINDAIRELMAQLKDWQAGTSNDPMVIGSSGSLTLNQGTANGVAYLNGSKVVTSGSALTFDGTALGVSGTVNDALSVTSTATTTALKLNNTNANGWGSNVAIFTGGTAAGYFGTIGSLLGSTAQDLTVYATASNGFRVYTNGNNERMRVTSGGDVGIGTSSPAGKLQVTSNNVEVYITDSTVSAPDSATLYLGLATVPTYAGLIADFSNDQLKIRHNQATRATFDSSGNLGLGVTPSTWAWPNGSAGALQLQSGAGLSGYNASTYLSQNWYYNGGEKYIGNGYANRYGMYGGGHAWFNAPNNTSGAGATVSWTQAMTLDASGNLSIGTTTGGYRLLVSDGTVNAYYTLAASTAYLGTKSNHPLAFSTNDTERARIDSSGNLLVGTTSQSGKLAVNGVATSVPLVTFYSSTAGDVGQPGLLIGKQDNNTTTSQVILRASILSTGAGAGQINMNGANSLAFGTYSDERLKENIVDLPPQLANILSLRPVEFDYIQSEGGGHQTGFIAQEMQQVYSDAVGEREDGMLTVSGWDKTTARLVKAIQEQQAIIESLKARLDAANI